MNGDEAAYRCGAAVCDRMEERLRMGGRMLALQAWRSSNTRTRNKLSNFVRRVHAAIDQYERRRFNGVRLVDAADYLEGLRRHLVAEATDEGGRAQLSFSCEMEALSNEGALLLGLIVSEVVADALDYDLSGRPPIVVVRVDSASSGFCLSVVDRRSGRSPWAWANGFGLTLVRQLVRESAESFTSAPGDARVRLHVLLANGSHALPLRNVSPNQPRTGFYKHSARSTQEALHEL